MISTHAPLAGRDAARSHIVSCSPAFQPTRPLRGATDVDSPAAAATAISTHAPLAGRDLAASRSTTLRTHFNPRAPCGARPTRSATRHWRR